jgi:hypothetical protein
MDAKYYPESTTLAAFNIPNAISSATTQQFKQKTLQLW